MPVDADYLAAIGMATYCFATMEWNAVYCGEKLKPGYVNDVSTKTAGVIANEILGFAPLVSGSIKQASYQAAVSELVALVKRRNDLMHANPATIGNDQRLVRNGIALQISDINDLADDFTACSLKLNELLQHLP
ncbi:hypothetical protein HN018_13195 [Lichenicola cladoniae]|uniref:RiboL-PSP-HEPN domain-containing protein n=1 Tax=Lichenicola cladoniae TaxID=1484109 RepID=A0A6M8HRH0_9PROT|nr:hypothetical protein [Lichenicola cladoniae]NPD69035.1 hypothetical protein [Acetobacteraceae bacterium]QKE90867.1 hypothetical protein HN018_13195 [Lichenicola cladoniae]